MAYLLTLYSVDQDRLVSCLGSKDQELYANILHAGRRVFKEDDRESAGCEFTSMTDLVRRIIDGERLIANNVRYGQVVYSLEQVLRYLADARAEGYTDEMHRIQKYCELDAAGCFIVEDQIPFVGRVQHDQHFTVRDILLAENEPFEIQRNELSKFFAKAAKTENAIYLIYG